MKINQIDFCYNLKPSSDLSDLNLVSCMPASDSFSDASFAKNKELWLETIVELLEGKTECEHIFFVDSKKEKRMEAYQPHFRPNPTASNIISDITCYIATKPPKYLCKHSGIAQFWKTLQCLLKVYI